MPRGSRGAGAQADMTNPCAGSRLFFSCRRRLGFVRPASATSCAALTSHAPTLSLLGTVSPHAGSSGDSLTRWLHRSGCGSEGCHRRSVCAPSPAWRRILCRVSRVHPGGTRYSPGWRGSAFFSAVSWLPASPPVSHVPRSCIPNNPPALQERTCCSNERIGGMWCAAFTKRPARDASHGPGAVSYGHPDQPDGGVDGAVFSTTGP